MKNEPRFDDVCICEGEVHEIPRSQAGQMVQKASPSVKMDSSCRTAAEPTPMGGNKLQTFSVVENEVLSTGFLNRGRHHEVLQLEKSRPDPGRYGHGNVRKRKRLQGK
jgi:hypothetical protein